MAQQKRLDTDWINYNHLHYFWVVAREGSIVRAAEELDVSQPTISLQIRDLEAAMGLQLFDRAGGKLTLTEQGKVVFSYADEMFALSRQMIDALQRRSTNRVLRLAVGISDAIPKSVARLLLEPAGKLEQPVRLVCREDKVDRLVADLVAYRTDVVLSDAPIGTGIHARSHNHQLGQCGITFLAARSVKVSGSFPKCLDGAPMLLPTDHTALRRALDLWFDSRQVHPTVAAECDDNAMLTAFGENGMGIFPVPTIVARETCRIARVRVVGSTDAVTARFYAITLDEKLSHPAVAAICEAARRDVF